MKSIINIFLCVILISFEAGAQVTDAPGYIDNLMQEFVTKLEKSEISGYGLPLPDWTAPMNTTKYGITAFGSVNFYSGFVNSIGMAVTNHQQIISTLLDDYVEINSTFYFENIRVFFDMEIDLVDYIDLGNALIQIPKIDYKVSLFHHYKTNVKTLKLVIQSIDVNKIESKLYPYNSYTQLITNQMTSPPFYTPLRDSILSGWTDLIQEKLDAVIATAANPTICYYCKQLEI